MKMKRFHEAVIASIYKSNSYLLVNSNSMSYIDFSNKKIESYFCSA